MEYRFIILGMLGGLGLFVYGMQLMGDGLQKRAGDKMRRLLEVLTGNRFMGLAVGATITAIVQSSSVTTVMVVGFVNAGLMTLQQAIGVILGAAIGTTITTQLVSFNLTALAEPAIVIGLIITMVSKRRKTKYTGQIILGFGILFFGMATMARSMAPLRSYEPFIDFLASFGQAPLLGILVSALFTALVQSSSATTAIIVALCSQGILGLDSAMPLILGSNVGTTITALLASIGTTLHARRTAIAHTIFKIVGVLIFLAILQPFAILASNTSQLVERQVANAHTIFNVATALLVLPFVSYFATMVTKLVPGDANDIQEVRKPLYLDAGLLSTPSIALGQSTRETLRMGGIAQQMLSEAMLAFQDNDLRFLHSALEKEEVINYLAQEITIYLVKLTEQGLSEEQSLRLSALLEVVHDIERVGDHADNLLELAEYKIEHELPFSETAVSELLDMDNQVQEIFSKSLQVLETQDCVLANKILQWEDNIDELEKQLRKNHISRLNKHICFPGSGVVFVDALSNLERIADHATSIARAVIEAETR